MSLSRQRCLHASCGHSYESSASVTTRLRSAQSRRDFGLVRRVTWVRARLLRRGARTGASLSVQRRRDFAALTQSPQNELKMAPYRKKKLTPYSQLVYREYQQVSIS